MADQDEDARRADALSTIADTGRSLPNTLSRGRQSWMAAIFGSALALISVIMAIPPAARLIFHTNDSNPIALLGALFYGWIAWLGIGYQRQVQGAKEYLRTHPQPGDPVRRRPTWWYVLSCIAAVIGMFYTVIALIFTIVALVQTDGPSPQPLLLILAGAGLVTALGYWGIHSFHSRQLPGQPTTRAR